VVRRAEHHKIVPPYVRYWRRMPVGHPPTVAAKLNNYLDNHTSVARGPTIWHCCCGNRRNPGDDSATDQQTIEEIPFGLIPAYGVVRETEKEE